MFVFGSVWLVVIIISYCSFIVNEMYLKTGLVRYFSLPLQYLDCLWAQIKNLRANKWSEKQIVRPYLAFDGVLCEALQHTLPQIIPPSHNEETTYPLPRVVFRMFDYTDVPEVGACGENHLNVGKWYQYLDTCICISTSVP